MHWNDHEDIVEALEEQFPELDVQSLSPSELPEYVEHLVDFEDDIENCDEEMLETILEKWINYREENF